MNIATIDNYIPLPPNFYAGSGKVDVTHANLPHWNRDNTAYFVTFRLFDSLPAEKLLALDEERCAWLESHPEPLSSANQIFYLEHFEHIKQKWLDNGYGCCLLKEAENKVIVNKALWHFAGDRYSLYAIVVMPNHVHVLFMPHDGFSAADIVGKWKSFTAHEINKRMGRTGPIWQKESFDTLVRSERHFNTIIRYIRENDLVGSWAYNAGKR